MNDLEEYQNKLAETSDFIREIKKNRNTNLLEFSCNTITDFFNLIDINKELKFNVTNTEELNRVTSFDLHIDEIFRSLSIPKKD